MDRNLPVMLLALLFSVVTHECAHGWVAYRCGDPTARLLGRLTLNPIKHIDPVGTILVPLIMALLPGGLLFGWAKPVPIDPTRLRDPLRDQALVAAAGPTSNLLLAGLCAVLLGLFAAAFGVPSHAGPGGVALDLRLFLFQLLYVGIQLNVLLALFNLIPIPPLDGSWILYRWLRGPAALFYDRLRPVGFFLVILLLYVGFGRWLQRGVLVVSGLYENLADQILRLLR
jgi:Zn-dependent protease